MRTNAVVVVKHTIAMWRVVVVAPREETQCARELLAIEHVIEMRIVRHSDLGVTLGERQACTPERSELRSRQRARRRRDRVALHAAAAQHCLAEMRHDLRRRVLRLLYVDLVDVWQIRGQHGVLVAQQQPVLHQQLVPALCEKRVRIDLQTEQLVAQQQLLQMSRIRRSARVERVLSIHANLIRKQTLPLLPLLIVVAVSTIDSAAFCCIESIQMHM